jgi:hypothetical protein
VNDNSVQDGNAAGAAQGNPKSASVSAPPLAEVSATFPNDPHYGAWREADDLVLFKLPGHEPFRISNKSAERLYYDFAKICGKPEAVAEPVEVKGQNELLPCPFCGNPNPELVETHRNHWHVGCSQCCPRLTRLAQFINAECGELVTATCISSWSNTDRHYKGSRLRWPGKGRTGNKLRVTARVRLRLSGFLYGDHLETFKPGQDIFTHDSSETYRYNAEAARKTIALIEQLKKS